MLIQRFLPALCAALLLAGCGDPISNVQVLTEPAPAATVAASDQAAEFRAFLEAAYQQDLARFPETASTRGIRTWQDRWNQESEAFLDEQRALWQQRLERLAEFDRSRLGRDDQLSFDLFEQSLRRSLAADAFRHHQYALTQFRGPHTSVPSFLANVHTLGSLADAAAYIARLRNLGGHFDEVIGQLEIRTAKGLFLPAWAYPKIVEAARNVISGAPFSAGEDSVIWADFQRKVAGLSLPEEQSAALLADARAALVEVVEPAYQRLVAAVQAQAIGAPADDGVWKFPEGETFYAERLRYFTTTDLDAQSVHQIGLQEVARIHAEMAGIMDAVGFTGSREEFFDFMRTDPQFYLPNTDAGRQAYLDAAVAAIDAMSARLPTVFGLLPEAEMVVKRVEPYRERAAGKAFYQAPPADGSRPGIYYANLHEMADMPTYQLEALAFHEGVPGHHMQRAISIELEDIPEFQKYASFTAYTEGWGLYSERLAKEMGFYTDPYSDFGRLAMELWRAARLVVDTGIHSQRWTREQAIAYLLENTPNSATDAAKAIERYIVMPGQATAYMIGQIRILELRDKARAALGEDFSLKAFHDEVLRDGPVSLDLLEQKIGQWIDSQRG